MLLTYLGTVDGDCAKVANILQKAVLETRLSTRSVLGTPHEFLFKGSLGGEEDVLKSIMVKHKHHSLNRATQYIRGSLLTNPCRDLANKSEERENRKKANDGTPMEQLMDYQEQLAILEAVNKMRLDMTREELRRLHI